VVKKDYQNIERRRK